MNGSMDMKCPYCNFDMWLDYTTTKCIGHFYGKDVWEERHTYVCRGCYRKYQTSMLIQEQDTEHMSLAEWMFAHTIK